MMDIPDPERLEAIVSQARAGLPPLGDASPQQTTRLDRAGPAMRRMWSIALDDCERNIVTEAGARYFGAGTNFGATVFTRDIAISGLFGLNRLYPELMLSSLKHTRHLRWSIGFAISAGYEELRTVADVPWEVVAPDEPELMRRFRTNNYARRTDDVIWLWATADLFLGCPRLAEWQWLLAEGERVFATFYEPFHDSESGLFRGQSCFVDVHHPHSRCNGYPQTWSIADCVGSCATSTNALYVQGMRCLALAAERCGDRNRAIRWRARSDALVAAIRERLLREDGRFGYLLDRQGRLDPRRHALGEAWAVELGIVTGDAARRALAGSQADHRGVPLYDPFFNSGSSYHDNSTWPFVSTWHCRSRAAAGLDDGVAGCAAMLAYACQNGFQEVIDARDGKVGGSPHQLWSAAAFLDLCRRAGLWHAVPMLTIC